MKVKAIREHVNMAGSTPKKSVGTEYEISDNLAKTLIAAGLVEEVAEKAKKA